MNITEEIKRLKKEKNAIILVHNYQRPEVQEIADILGDSLELAKKAAVTEYDTIVFCGVRFMAETAKILSPKKTVLLPRADAGCPMANMINANQLKLLKEKHPEAIAVTYVNSTAEVKAETDVCCTSANAIKVTQGITANEIIFSPDKNLGAYCQRFTNKKIIAHDGYCYVHNQITVEDIKDTQKTHPNAAVIVHPECPAAVIDIADAVKSTSGMITYAKESTYNEFIIATEEGLVHRLRKEIPEKKFYTLNNNPTCKNMKRTHLEDVYKALNENQHELFLSEEIIARAKKPLEEMLKYV